MSEHYDFHYQPTGSGAISGQQVLEQTEDAINELGDYVNDNVGGAMDVAQQALETAQNAEQDAQTALDTANSFSSGNSGKSGRKFSRDYCKQRFRTGKYFVRYCYCTRTACNYCGRQHRAEYKRHNGINNPCRNCGREHNYPSE